MTDFFARIRNRPMKLLEKKILFLIKVKLPFTKEFLP